MGLPGAGCVPLSANRAKGCAAARVPLSGRCTHPHLIPASPEIPPSYPDCEDMKSSAPHIPVALTQGGFTMRHNRNRLGRRAIIAVSALVALLSVSGYAFTASNTVPNATVGQGANTISG